MVVALKTFLKHSNGKQTSHQSFDKDSKTTAQHQHLVFTTTTAVSSVKILSSSPLTMSTSLFIVLAILLSALCYQVFNQDDSLTGEIKVISNSKFVEDHLLEYKDLIGNDYDGYRNHIYRVLTYTMHFLNGEEKHLRTIAAALVYHDLGLWTDGTLSYIEPSCHQAKKHLTEFNDVDQQLIHDIIDSHHKFTAFTGPGEKVVNAVRKADWMDASYGVLSKGMPRKHIRAVMDAIPEAGFHQTLMDFGPRLHGMNVYKIVTGLAKIFRY